MAPDETPYPTKLARDEQLEAQIKEASSHGTFPVADHIANLIGIGSRHLGMSHGVKEWKNANNKCCWSYGAEPEGPPDEYCKDVQPEEPNLEGIPAADFVGNTHRQGGYLGISRKGYAEWDKCKCGEGVRTFNTGATRDTDEGKYEYNGFNSPLVEKRFAEYMHHHRHQSNGELRAPDNWKKGLPVETYLASLHRHFIDLWLYMDGYPHEAREQNLEDILCALRFNVNGLLLEKLKERKLMKETEKPVEEEGYVFPS